MSLYIIHICTVLSVLYFDQDMLDICFLNKQFFLMLWWIVMYYLLKSFVEVLKVKEMRRKLCTRKWRVGYKINNEKRASSLFYGFLKSGILMNSGYVSSEKWMNKMERTTRTCLPTSFLGLDIVAVRMDSRSLAPCAWFHSARIHRHIHMLTCTACVYLCSRLDRNRLGQL